ncbi:hypothetical protein PUMCH_001242 [Australozyma saopauloensis]|uniref:Reverse transcriptase domain-containing protein n=1 Tax=Australozyma saopauloensis TaxID=291208 RepID=A0AAX4H6B2_9ASCO|nr:hypothetical protein PUMCH_001242 [[Candida] saopauloensis]
MVGGGEGQLAAVATRLPVVDADPLRGAALEWVAAAVVDVGLPAGQVLVVLLYAPCSSHGHRQLAVLRAMFAAIEEYASSHDNMKMVLGGDFNNVQNDHLDVKCKKESRKVKGPSGAMAECREEVARAINQYQLVDVMRLLYLLLVHGTNRLAHRSRRLDRVYVTPWWAGRIYRYRERADVSIVSTHVTVEVTMVLDPSSMLEVGKPRFIAPPCNYQMPRMPASAEWDTVVANAQARAKRNRSRSSSSGRVFTELRDGEIVETTTKGMLHMATRHCLKCSWPGIPQEFGKTMPWPQRSCLSVGQMEMLLAPFTKKELWNALKGAPPRSAPGEDGLLYQYWKATWLLHGDALTTVANELRQGRVPLLMTKTLFVLQPKKGKGREKQVSGYRPVALINTSLKIICRAINERLHLVADVVVMDAQRGFMRGRHMNGSIAQFRQIMEYMGETGVAMVDFADAFGSVSHQYLDEQLAQWCPLELRISIMAILMTLRAAVWLNNTEGEVFRVRRGTLQGNPFLPFLFAMALDPFLRLLTERLSGVMVKQPGYPYWYTQVVVSAFADDLVVYVKLQKEIDELLLCLRQFTWASRCEVNASKSRVYTLKEELEDCVYLGFSWTPLDWASEQRKLLGVALRFARRSPTQFAQRLNAFVFLRVYFRDYHTPMTVAEIDLFKAAVARKFPGVSARVVFLPIRNGGLGCVDMLWQLMGGRAMYVHHVITRYADGQWELEMTRRRLQWMLFQCCVGSEERRQFELHNGRARVQVPAWWSFLRGGHFKIDGTLFLWKTCDMAKYMLPTETVYLEAWFKLTNPTAHDGEWMLMGDDGRLNYHGEIWYDTRLFHSVTKQHVVESVVSRTVQGMGQKPSQKFWKEVAKRAAAGAPLDYVHLFHVGGDVGVVAAFGKCLLCGGDDKTHAHVFVACTVAREVWRACELYGEPRVDRIIGVATKGLDRYLYVMRMLLRWRSENAGASVKPMVRYYLMKYRHAVWA